MDKNGVKLWIKNIWQRHPETLRNPQSILVWDMFRSHLTDNTKKLLTECNTDIAVIPGGLTSLVQPLDMCINKPFKQNLKRQRNIWMLEGEKSFTKGGQMRHASLEIVCEWIIKAWNEIKPDLIQKSIKKCSVSNSVDQTEDDYLVMDESNSDGENGTDFDDVPEDITCVLHYRVPIIKTFPIMNMKEAALHLDKHLTILTEKTYSDLHLASFVHYTMLRELWFQQDGATCHTARATIDLLKYTFGDRLISRFGPVNWPPRSCDLTPLDYFLWGYVKSLVYADKPQTLDHLEDNIRRVIADIRPQMLDKVIENWTSRLDYIRASRGSPMPEIIFKM
ncbi:pogo transposable element with KRAB domain [Trichonephila clavipes]|nr:pogo transposable element with KRAB domain [Trichonephila clavipes]